ncbi:hypothetical protein [Marinomonas aquiplantarum]|uniref:Type VI secretion system protein n=1 Tax=Marinomonas aquiplantarum TaxID=491951 RepID=A0A366CW54_9GAMM|nr:hypothetical protein [Marinomonas aquiplantarum]RBO81896.1 hypothetical protein DFP76_10739 [Marinomonas aquiplantarum]
MPAALFEKLTLSERGLSTKASVIANVERILSSGGFLDAGVDELSIQQIRGEGAFPHNLSALVDQSLNDHQQIDKFQHDMVQILQLFEPRIEQIQVLNVGSVGQMSRCRLSIQLRHEQFEEAFEFGVA